MQCKKEREEVTFLGNLAVGERPVAAEHTKQTPAVSSRRRLPPAAPFMGVQDSAGLLPLPRQNAKKPLSAFQ